MNFNYQDQDRTVIVSIRSWPWKREELLNDLDAVKHLLDSLKNLICSEQPTSEVNKQ